MPNPATARRTPAAAADAKGGVGGKERRRSRRGQVISMGMHGTLRAAGAPDSMPPDQVMVTDVSLHGVGFRSPTKLAADSLHFIEIGVGPLHLSSRLRIARISKRPDGSYDVGAEFV